MTSNVLKSVEVRILASKHEWVLSLKNGLKSQPVVYGRLYAHQSQPSSVMGKLEVSGNAVMLFGSYSANPVYEHFSFGLCCLVFRYMLRISSQCFMLWMFISVANWLHFVLWQWKNIHTLCYDIFFMNSSLSEWNE